MDDQLVVGNKLYAKYFVKSSSKNLGNGLTFFDASEEYLRSKTGINI